MDTTFISIHDLTPNACILYSSDSVIDILQYTPDEIVNRSAWDFFDRNDLPYAKQFHQRRITTDKAAVLAYCRVKNKDGFWVGCEVCFSVAYDVMIVCTSIYRRGAQSMKRAQEAPIVRRIFDSSPKDPRYNMLSHLSTKFTQPVPIDDHEPRAALFLNRFTRTLSIMYATAGIVEVIGIPAETMRGRSFYYCIAENCLPDAVKCLENAKSNDSIAYLRFWFRDPRVDDPPPPDDDSDEEMTTDRSEDTDDGGIHLQSDPGTSPKSGSTTHSSTDMDVDMEMGSGPNSRTSSGHSTNAAETHEAIFGSSRPAHSSTSSLVQSPQQERVNLVHDPIELEAVISCTSDGLVVMLRKARPMIPHPAHRPSRPVHENGLFAAPWATEPILPPIDSRSGAGFGGRFAPSLGPQGAKGHLPSVKAPGAITHDFMQAIREQAIFSWALTGINGSLAEFGIGKPLGESLPRDGLPIWASDPKGMRNKGGLFDRPTLSPQDSRAGTQLFGDPGLDRSGSSGRSPGNSNSNSNSHSGGGTPFQPS